MIVNAIVLVIIVIVIIQLLKQFFIFQALLVLDYIIKRGSERVAQQCKEQIYSLLTLQDFRFVDKDGKDQGASGECVLYVYLSRVHS